MADKHENLQCEVCGQSYAPHFSRCPYCCPHDELEPIEEWRGADDGGGWEIGFQSKMCGRDFGFTNEFIIDNFKLIRK